MGSFSLSIGITHRCFATTSRRMEHYKVLIAGGGAGGLNVASRLRKRVKGPIGIIEPSKTHYYQPLFTLVGASQCSIHTTKRRTTDLIPEGVVWHENSVRSFECEDSSVVLNDGSRLKYDTLIVAIGIETDYSQIKGLKEAFEDGYAVTNYGPEECVKTAKAIETFRGGRAIFTMPATPLKCPGAPQKIMFLAEEKWRGKEVKIDFISGLGKQFAVPAYADALIKVCDARGITREYNKNLIEIRKNIAVFMKGSERIEEKFDFLHVGPPQVSPKVLTDSALCPDKNKPFASVDPYTLQSSVFSNVFVMGDCSDVPTSRTAAAASVQAKVVAANVLFEGASLKFPGKYSGYASCPLLCGNQECIMAEFNAFTGERMESTPFDQSLPRKSMFLVKKYILPWVYWNAALRGIWSGPAPIRRILSIFRPLYVKSEV